MFVPYVGRHVLPNTAAAKSGEDEKLMHVMGVNLAEPLVR
jgi:hypothetical protein